MSETFSKRTQETAISCSARFFLLYSLNTRNWKTFYIFFIHFFFAFIRRQSDGGFLLCRLEFQLVFGSEWARELISSKFCFMLFYCVQRAKSISDKFSEAFEKTLHVIYCSTRKQRKLSRCSTSFQSSRLWKTVFIIANKRSFSWRIVCRVQGDKGKVTNNYGLVDSIRNQKFILSHLDKFNEQFEEVKVMNSARLRCHYYPLQKSIFLDTNPHVKHLIHAAFPMQICHVEFTESRMKSEREKWIKDMHSI